MTDGLFELSTCRKLTRNRYGEFILQRRSFIVSGVVLGMLADQLHAENTQARFEAAVGVLADAVEQGQVHAATLVARLSGQVFQRAFGKAALDSPFLLGSISKPICMAALMTLFDQKMFGLDDPVHKFLPEFRDEGRQQVTVRHLLTHVSGLPDQLPNNSELRRGHAPLSDFVKAATRVPLAFAPGSKYEYSSMGILLAAEIAQRLSQTSLLPLVQHSVLDPLGMSRSALGVGRLPLAELIPVQIEHAAVEAGGGDPTAKNWDWNSRYWRELGAPWGGVHASAGDILKFLDAFALPEGKLVAPDTARLMIQNHNTHLLVPRGLGFALGPLTICTGCSSNTFGHTGSTGTLAWCDPQTRDACVVLTSLPGQALKPHPRDLASHCLTAAG